MGKPGSRIIGDGFCPWRNYEKGVKGEGHFHDVQTWLQDNRGDGFCPGRNYEKGVKGEGHFMVGKPGSRIIWDGFCPWRNYEERVQGGW